jgi:4'-phosphopantetheinyl transferase
VQFNLSHSGQLGLVACARGREIGVDIEQRRPVRDLLALARTAFSPAEYAAFSALPPPDQLHAFFSCWSRKEAFIKATGEGISQLADFDVSLAPGEPARLLRVAGEPLDRPRWSLHDLPAIADHAAALVLERREASGPDGRDAHIACWDWEPISSRTAH